MPKSRPRLISTRWLNYRKITIENVRMGFLPFLSFSDPSAYPKRPRAANVSMKTCFFFTMSLPSSTVCVCCFFSFHCIIQTNTKIVCFVVCLVPFVFSLAPHRSQLFSITVTDHLNIFACLVIDMFCISSRHLIRWLWFAFFKSTTIFLEPASVYAE